MNKESIMGYTTNNKNNYGLKALIIDQKSINNKPRKVLIINQYF